MLIIPLMIGRSFVAAKYMFWYLLISLITEQRFSNWMGKLTLSTSDKFLTCSGRKAA